MMAPVPPLSLVTNARNLRNLLTSRSSMLTHVNTLIYLNFNAIWSLRHLLASVHSASYPVFEIIARMIT